MKSVILDANLLVLLVVGLTDRSLIGDRHKRMQDFQPADLDLLMDLLAPVPEIIVTPHALAEADNIATQIGDPLKSEIRRTLGQLVMGYVEGFVDARTIVQNTAYLRLGVSDVGMIELAKSGTPVLTSDVHCYLEAARFNCETMNFNHLRQARMLE